jgi:hypothetical protein
MICNHAKSAIFINGKGLKILHALVLGSINVALFQSKYSYNFSSNSSVTVNTGGIINDGTVPMTRTKDRIKGDL